jgi:hypothetical protein
MSEPCKIWRETPCDGTCACVSQPAYRTPRGMSNVSVSARQSATQPSENDRHNAVFSIIIRDPMLPHDVSVADRELTLCDDGITMDRLTDLIVGVLPCGEPFSQWLGTYPCLLREYGDAWRRSIAWDAIDEAIGDDAEILSLDMLRTTQFSFAAHAIVCTKDGVTYEAYAEMDDNLNVKVTA